MDADVLVIGGGAAGYMAAITAARTGPGLRVWLAEQSRPLEKVRISGGGRCNATHHLADPVALSKHYPRGERFLRQAFRQWGQPQAVAWFAAEGVRLVAEPDGRMFPSSNTSQTIVDCLQQAAKAEGVQTRLGLKVTALAPTPSGHWQAHTADGHNLQVRKVIVCAGGSPSAKGLAWLAALGLPIVSPVPSLFSFNLPQSPLQGLEGLSAPATVRIVGTASHSTGPVLITHWGISGPAVLRQSAWQARQLHAWDYVYQVRVQWLHGHTDAQVLAMLEDFRHQQGRKLVTNTAVGELPRRLWERLCQLAGVEEGTPWATLPAKARNRLLELLMRQELAAQGRTTYKEEFVTAGGIDLKAVSPDTLETTLPGLYAAGEVLDIDGVTGGFNFQAAWTTGFLAGQAAARACRP